MSEEKTIGYVYNLVTTLGDGQQLTVSGNLALGATKEDMGQEFDKLLAVTNRLAAKHKIAAKKGLIAADEAMINSMQLDMNALEEKNGSKPLPTVEKQNRDVMVRNIRHLEGRVASYREDIVGLEKEAE